MKSRGFTIIELIIVIAILSAVGSVVITTYSSTKKTGDTIRQASIFAAALKEAVKKAEAMEYDSAWGVKLQSTSTILFSGNSFAARTVARDLVYQLPADVVVTGPTEIVFAKFTGTPSGVGTTTFSNGFATNSVYIWTAGIVEN